MIDSCICLYFSPQFHMLHTERCSARRKTGCHHPWKLRFLWLCSHGLRYTGRPVYSSYSFHTSYLFSFLPCLVSTGGAVPVDAFSGVSAIRHSPPHHNPGCALHHILAPQCPNHIQQPPSTAQSTQTFIFLLSYGKRYARVTWNVVIFEFAAF